MAPPRICPQRPFRWEGVDFTLPAISDVRELKTLGPLILDDKFWAFPVNRKKVVLEKIKSCLNTAFVQYITVVAKQEIMSQSERQLCSDAFKNSREWDLVLERCDGRYKSIGAIPPLKPAPSTKVPPRAPTGPAMYRDSNANMISLPNTSESSQRPPSRPLMPPGRDFAVANFAPWELPDAPTWSLSNMTFQRFVDTFVQKNRIDATKGFVPWDSIMSAFKDYIKKYWPRAGEEVMLNHVTWALEHTKIRHQIPSALLEKHERRLRMEALDLKSSNGRAAMRPLNGAQQTPVLPSSFSVQIGQGAARPGIDAAGVSKKRAYAGNDGSPASPASKHVKIEQESPLVFQRNTNFIAPPGTENGLPSRVDPGQGNGGQVTGPSAPNHYPVVGPVVAQNGLVRASGSPAGSAAKAALQEEARKAPSPAASATAWLQTNISNGTPSAHSNGLHSPDRLLPIAAPVVAPGAATSTALMPSLPPAAMGRGSITRSVVKLDIIVNGALEDLGGIIASANEPSTTEPLTANQRNVLGQLIWSHKNAVKELVALQNALGGGGGSGA